MNKKLHQKDSRPFIRKSSLYVYILVLTSITILLNSCFTKDKFQANSSSFYHEFNDQRLDSIEMILSNNDLFFINLVTNYYPLSADQIDKYGDYIDFKLLSKNRQVLWSDELIDNYKNRWDYTQLQRNNGVEWDQKMIEKYHNESWFRIYEIAFNRKIYVDKDFFDKYYKYYTSKMIMESDVKNKVLLFNIEKEPNIYRKLGDYLKKPHQGSPELKAIWASLIKQSENNIKEYDTDFLYRNSEYINWRKYCSSVYIDWSYTKIDVLQEFIVLSKLLKSEKAYESVFAAVLDDNFIETRFDDIISQRKNQLFVIKKSKSKVKLNSNKFTDELEQEYIDSTYLADSNLFNGSLAGLYETLPVFVDYYEIRRAFYGKPIRVISKKLLKILEAHNLPSYHVYPIDVNIDSYWYGKEMKEYYLFFLDDLEFSDFNFEESKLESKHLFENKQRKLQEDEVSYIKKRRLIYFYSYGSRDDKSMLKSVVFNGNYDLMHDGNGKFIVSERLIDSFREFNIEGIDIDYFNRLTFKMTEKPIDQKINVSFSNQKIQQKTLVDFQIKKDSIVKLIYSSSFENYLSNLDTMIELTHFEKKNEVILPKEYKACFMKNDFQDFSSLYSGNEFHKQRNVSPIYKGRCSRFPFLNKGIEIGRSNDGSDLLLLLEKDDPFRLSPKIYTSKSLSLYPPRN